MDKDTKRMAPEECKRLWENHILRRKNLNEFNLGKLGRAILQEPEPHHRFIMDVSPWNEHVVDKFFKERGTKDYRFGPHPEGNIGPGMRALYAPAKTREEARALAKEIHDFIDKFKPTKWQKFIHGSREDWFSY